MKRAGQCQTAPNNAAVGSNATPSDLVVSLRPLIRSLLPDGYPRVAQVARLSGLSLRTFQRKLAEIGVNFSDLLEEARLDLALAMLRDPAVRITDVALDLGYADSAAFIRAFSTGMRPSLLNSVACAS